jgi:hypothetical protein
VIILSELKSITMQDDANHLSSQPKRTTPWNKGKLIGPAHGALGLDPLRMDQMIPEAHRLGVSKALVHRVLIVDAELTQAQASG